MNTQIKMFHANSYFSIVFIFVLHIVGISVVLYCEELNYACRFSLP